MKTVYGVQWPDDTPQATIELYFYRYQEYSLRDNLSITELGGEIHGKSFHFKNAIKEIFTEQEVVDNPWLDRMIDIWCDEEHEDYIHDGFATIWGPASSGKSNAYGLCALVDWWAAPEDTCTFVCSTTKPMLEKRIWEAVIRYFNAAKKRHKDGVPGKVSKSRLAIINDNDEDLGDEVKAGITGVAVQMGSVEDAKSSLIGSHLPFVRLIIDEMQATRRAAVEARSNLSKGCIEFLLLGMGNPMSKLDVLGEHSKPIHGWESVSLESVRWQTQFGMCYFFDGFKSPAITEPNGAKQFPFLINRKQIDKDIKTRGGEENHPDVWTMCRGFVPPDGLSSTVLTLTMIEKFDMDKKAVWQYDVMNFLGVDPAFTSGGDDCIAVPAKLGYLDTGQYAVEFQDPILVPITVVDSNPIIYQIAYRIIEICKDMKIPIENVSIDETGTQSVGDVIEKEWMRGLHRVYFGNKASDIPVTHFDSRRCEDVYADMVTELWFSMQNFGQYNQIRNLPEKAQQEFCERMIILGSRGRKKVESKKDMKERIGRSPDTSDGCVVILSNIRRLKGVLPGSQKGKAGISSTMDAVEIAKRYDLDAKPKYTTDPVTGEKMSPYA